MKNVYFTLIFLFVANCILHATTITAVTNLGQWTTNSTWNLNRRPANNDTVIIPSNITVRFRSTQNLNKIILKIYGTLIINEGDLKLSSNSVIYVYPNGQIRGQSAGIIEIGSIKKFDYSNAAINGAMMANNITGGEPFGFVTFAVLPVTFIEFSAVRNSNSIILVWTTADEHNNHHFEIERSTNGINWIAVGNVLASNKAFGVNHYKYIHQSSSSSNVYYRLKQVDIDGKFMYSQIKKIANIEADFVKIYSSSEQKISFEFSEPANSVIMKLLSLNGQIIHIYKFKESTLRYELNIPATIKGVYVVQVITNNANSTVKKIIL